MGLRLDIAIYASTIIFKWSGKPLRKAYHNHSLEKWNYQAIKQTTVDLPICSEGKSRQMSLSQATKFGLGKEKPYPPCSFWRRRRELWQTIPELVEEFLDIRTLEFTPRTKALSVGGGNEEVALGPFLPCEVPRKRRSYETSQP